MRYLAAATFLIFLFLFVTLYRTDPTQIKLPPQIRPGKDTSQPAKSPLKAGTRPQGWDHDPQEDPSGEPAGTLHRVKGDNYAPDNANSDRINATLLSLVRNEELDDMLQSMHDLERTWNHKFNYPWTFFNNVNFTEEFIQKTSAATKAKTHYRTSPIPSHINTTTFTTILPSRNPSPQHTH